MTKKPAATAENETESPMSTQRIHVSIGGYAGSSFALKLRKTGLLYEAFEYGYVPETKRILHPDDEAYAKFWLAMDTIGTWRWSASYADPGVVDGTLWSVKLRHDQLQVASSGCNAYPRRFPAFLKAVQALIGGLPFA